MNTLTIRQRELDKILKTQVQCLLRLGSEADDGEVLIASSKLSYIHEILSQETTFPKDAGTWSHYANMYVDYLAKTYWEPQWNGESDTPAPIRLSVSRFGEITVEDCRTQLHSCGLD